MCDSYFKLDMQWHVRDAYLHHLINFVGPSLDLPF